MTLEEAVQFLINNLSPRAQIVIINEEIIVKYFLLPEDGILKKFVSEQMRSVEEQMISFGFTRTSRPGYKGKAHSIWSIYQDKKFIGAGFSYRKR